MENTKWTKDNYEPVTRQDKFEVWLSIRDLYLNGEKQEAYGRSCAEMDSLISYEASRLVALPEEKENFSQDCRMKIIESFSTWKPYHYYMKDGTEVYDYYLIGDGDFIRKVDVCREVLGYSFFKMVVRYAVVAYYRSDAYRDMYCRASFAENAVARSYRKNISKQYLSYETNETAVLTRQLITLYNDSYREYKEGKICRKTCRRRVQRFIARNGLDYYECVASLTSLPYDLSIASPKNRCSYREIC